MHQSKIEISTPGRGLMNITAQVKQGVQGSTVSAGLCHVFIHHTSASLIIQENADPDVQLDLEAFFSRLVHDADPTYRHTDEGPDDMSAHIRSVLTATSLTIPVVGGRLSLGTWQGLYLWEHRTHPHKRSLTITVIGS